MRLLVVGASGFIGKNLLAAVGPNFEEIVATYNTSPDFLDYVARLHDERITAVNCDLRDSGDAESLFSRFKDFDRCIYLASDTRVGFLSTNQSADVTNNILTVANFAQRYRGGPMAYFSSGAVYMGQRGIVSHDSVRPSIPYSISKYASELYLQHAAKTSSFGCNIVRFFGAYGPYEPERKVTRKLLLAIASSSSGTVPFTVYGDGRNLIDVMYVDDAIKAALCVLNSKKSDLVVDLCGESAVTINEFVTKICRSFHKRPKITHQGSSPEYIRFRATNREFRRNFGFQPTISLDQGVRKYMEYLRPPTSAG